MTAAAENEAIITGDLRRDLEHVFVQILNTREPAATWEPSPPEDTDTVLDRGSLAA